MYFFKRQILFYFKILCLGLWGKSVVWGSPSIDQSINSGGGWTSSSQHSSFTVYGELFQSSTAQSSTHTAELNSSISLEMIWVEPGYFYHGQSSYEMN